MTETQISFVRHIARGLLLVSVLFMSACSPSSDDPVPGTDGDWEAADLMDSDSDNTGDDDAMEDDADATAEENGAEEEFFDTEEAEADNADMEPDSDAEVDTEVEAEEETPAQPGVITVEELPWEGLTVQSCGEDMDSDASLAASRAVWGDDRGAVYFGGDNFWVLVEDGDTQTLTCDAGMIWPMFSMDGRIGDSGNELWTGHDRRIGHYVNNQWSFMDLPTEMLTEEETGGKNTVVDIDIAGDVISVLTRAKLGLYNPATHQWQVSTDCPEDLNRDYGLAFDGEKLWASARVVLYTVNLETAAFQEEFTVEEEPEDLETVGITGADDDGVWMVQYYDYQARLIIYSNRIASYDGQKIHYYPVRTYGRNYPLLSGSGGMGGVPLVYFRYYLGVGSPTLCGDTLFYQMQLAVSTPDGVDTAVSGYTELCKTCEVAPHCMSTYQEADKELKKTKSWRGANTLWHMYDTPRRYRW